jgi:hypothetical protein
LIFEALKKLDREKQVPERGFVVVAPTPWPEARKRRLGWLALASGLVLLVGFLAFALLRSNKPGGGTSARVESALAAVPSGATVPRSRPSTAATAESPAAAPLAPAQDATPVPDPATASASDRARPPVAEHKTPAATAVRASQPPAASARPAAPGLTPPAPTAPATTGGAPTPIWERPAARQEPHPSRSEAEAGPAQAESPARSRSSTDTPLQLQAITEQDGHPVAMVNGRLVKEGDSFDGVKILRIQPTEVEVEVQGRRRVLRF